MIYRRRKAMRSAQLLWLTTIPPVSRRIGFDLINTSRPPRQLGVDACISSRITTVIQVVRYYQINYNWYNEPFAVSQYKLFILRHAWLNLWDKRMTTGRINQVTSPWTIVEHKFNIISHKKTFIQYIHKSPCIHLIQTSSRVFHYYSLTL